jgi:hypothetical protein
MSSIKKENPQDQELLIDKKLKVGFNSVVSLNVKTIIWILVGLWSIFSGLAAIGYFDIKNSMKKQTIETKTTHKDMTKEVEEKKLEMIEGLDIKLQPIRDDVEELTKVYGEMKGDIKVILDRTSPGNPRTPARNFEENIPNVPTNSVPTNSVPNRRFNSSHILLDSMNLTDCNINP